METLVVNFVKPMNNEENRDSIFINSSPRIVINSMDFLLTLNMSQQQIMARIGRWINQGSGYVIDSVNEHYINVVKYDPLRGNSHIPLPPELQHPRKGLINIQNEDNECFRWCHVRYINPKTEIPLDKMPCDNQKPVIFYDYLNTGIKNDAEIRHYFPNSRNKNYSCI